jgi:hypothetical protein
MNKIATSHIVTGFNAHAVGSRVLDEAAFRQTLDEAVAAHDFPENGQAFITLPESAHQLVSAGVAKLAGLSDDDLFVVTWRGLRRICAPREAAAPVESLHVVVYTLDAYANDPDAQGDSEEARRVQQEVADFEREGVTHVLIAVLATAGPKPPYGPLTLLRNVAGANAEFLPTGNAERDAVLLQKIIGHAKDTVEYASEWVLVADR